MDLVQELCKRPKDFSFIQVIRILSKKLGKDYHKKIMIKPYLSLGFPTNDVIDINKKKDTYEIIVSFLGLYGASSPLPTFYTEELIDEKNDDRSVKRDFIDIFNVRAYELYFDLWLKTHPGVLFNEYKDESIKKILININYPLSIDRIKKILKNFGFKVEIEEFIKSYTYVETKQTTCLSLQNNMLGENSHLGNKISHTKKFRIVLNLVNRRDFFSFLNKVKEINYYLFLSLKEVIEWEWKINFSKLQQFKMGEMSLGMNCVLGKCNEITLKELKWL